MASMSPVTPNIARLNDWISCHHHHHHHEETKKGQFYGKLDKQLQVKQSNV